MSDYFAPILKRILAVTGEFQSLTQASRDAIIVSDKASADIEDFMTKLEAAHRAHLEAYESGIKLSVDHDTLSAELNRLSNMPASTEKLADIGTMSLMMRDVISQNYIEAAIKLGQLDIALYDLMFRELASYDDWPAKFKAICEAIHKIESGGKDVESHK